MKDRKVLKRQVNCFTLEETKEIQHSRGGYLDPRHKKERLKWATVGQLGNWKMDKVLDDIFEKILNVFGAKKKFLVRQELMLL